MKSFFISLGLLSFFIVITVINCFKVDSILGHVSDVLDSLPQSVNNYISPEMQKSTGEILGYWKSNRKLLSLSINSAELRDCEIALADLACFSESDTGADYNSALSEAKIRIAVLREREKLSVRNIL